VESSGHLGYQSNASRVRFRYLLPNHSLPRTERGIFESGPGQLGDFA
jgi:hypothetical protein